MPFESFYLGAGTDQMPTEAIATLLLVFTEMAEHWCKQAPCPGCWGLLGVTQE